MDNATITIEGVALPIKATPASKIWPAINGVLQKDAKEWLDDDWDKFLTALFWSIRRAGGEVTKDWLAMNVDIHNLADVLKTFAAVNTLSQNGDASGNDPGPAPSVTGPTSPAT